MLCSSRLAGPKNASKRLEERTKRLEKRRLRLEKRRLRLEERSKNVLFAILAPEQRSLSRAFFALGY